MAAVEVCVVAWLAWGVVAGLLGVVWDGSGPVLGPFGKVLDKPFWTILVDLDPLLKLRKKDVYRPPER